MRVIVQLALFMGATASFLAPMQLRATSRAAGLRMMAGTGTCVITDGTDSFYGSRTIFQAIYDHGDFERLTAFSSSIKEAKKMCISRQARYSGLIDALDFAEGGEAELAAAARKDREVMAYWREAAATATVARGQEALGSKLAVVWAREREAWLDVVLA